MQENTHQNEKNRPVDFMGSKKKSFVLYADLIDTVKELPRQTAGDLFLHILEFVNGNEKAPEELLLKVVFGPIRQQIKRDWEKWQKTTNERSVSGKMGGLKSGEVRRSKMKQNEGVLHDLKQTEPNEADNDNVIDNVIDNDNENDNENVKLLRDSYNKLWDLYGKLGSKEKAWEVFKNLPESDRWFLEVQIETYLENKPEVKFRQHFERYLSEGTYDSIESTKDYNVIEMKAPF